jgi:hypothetical protein
MKSNSYQFVVKNNGFRIAESKKAIEVVSLIRKG